ncbi:MULTISPECIES: ATP-binding protein [Paraburkholderia]|uniref:histidine kinase n=1 Tax=Paraburkholderia caribensis TaxID=75105 RepID=A0A9Q6S0Q5_9BURK|nr:MULTISPECIES: ATP-binding protein [Paraburkholderia]ALP61436.1 histidine kinase [Paraburkholderia caribensis]AMV41124.1 histidine kinase [Paraburkholderia caribensis]AUT50442.1 two-component sensor histidine kinase [Paraburkholderia caribensis]MCO4875949.1 ATP-binding protein [Paraburkholderia caribensis]MDR6383000.1 two-component system sensor histidine kinase RegB [Paraburkholderia caribensis]
MHRITVTGRVNLGHLFWLRSLAIIGQLVTIAFVQTFVGVKLPLPAMLLVIGLEVIFNALTWLRVASQKPESNLELFGQLWVDLGALSALLFLSGGTTNPFVSLYLPSLAIAAAVLPWQLMAWLAAFAVACYAVLGFESVPLNLDNPANLFDYYRAGMWVNFMVSVGLIAWFVARMSRGLRQRDTALGEAQQRLLRDERAVALGVQAATVAHEMGTPLSTIAMLTEELRDAARSDEGLKAYAADLDILDQQLTLCTSALARLRSRASTQGSRQRVDEWLDSFANQWRLRHPHVKFERVGEPPANVSVDDTVAVSQILTILLDNAARASRDHVTLAARLADNDSIDFEVCDAGPGVPASLRGLLGAAPVDSTQGGHGVGLYLAFSAAARLGGSIELTDVSEIKPRGTRAVLRLPLAREQTDAGRQGAASSNTEKQA